MAKFTATEIVISPTGIALGTSACPAPDEHSDGCIWSDGQARIACAYFKLYTGGGGITCQRGQDEEGQG